MTKKILSACLLMAFSAGAATYQSTWKNELDRNWAGKDFWANRLQDWQVKDGRLECIAAGKSMAYRNVHLIPYRIGNESSSIKASVNIDILTEQEEGLGGFILGIGSAIGHLKSSLVFGSEGKGNGIFAGLNSEGQLIIKDMEHGKILAMSDDTLNKKSDITVSLHFEDGLLKLEAEEYSIQVALKWSRLSGNLALTSHAPKKSKARFAFKNWRVEADSLIETQTKDIGPIISAQHTLSRRTLKMTAQLAPVYSESALLHNQDLEKVSLEIKKQNQWIHLEDAIIVVPGYTAHFRQPNWDDTQDTQYRLVYKDRKKDDSFESTYFEGTIKANPTNQKNIQVAAFTGNHNLTSWGGPLVASDERIAYPHRDLYERVMQHEPDLFFWSGDQVYEGGSPSGPDKSGEITSYYDYLYKWYLWCLSVRDMTRDTPCVVLPDDHDVYHGNIWGAGGKPTKRQDSGGYQMPSEWVRMVDRTQSSHHPDPFDSRPIGYGLQSYFTDMVYGRISFAILEDRKFKQGPRGTVVPADYTGRADHVTDPSIDTRKFNKPGLTLLGSSQLKFLNSWSQDWQGADMKCVLTQSVFANVATHHGPGAMKGEGFLVADFDSNGWPQSGRDRALREIRRGYAFTIGGDQHLGSIVKHGIDDWNDCGFAFTVPSIANFYPRAWLPKTKGLNMIDGMPSYTGEHYDSFKNKLTVWAVNNPGKKTGHYPASIHDRMPGYGIIRFEKNSRDITMECWPRFASPNDRTQIYEGWPKTVNASENYGRKALAYLPTLKIEGLEKPVVQVIHEATGEVIYTLRTLGKSFRPKVFSKSPHTIRIGDPDKNTWKQLKGIKPSDTSLKIKF